MKPARLLPGLLLAGFAAGLLLVVATPARAEVCDDFAWGLPAGPVAAGLRDGDLGRGRRLCGRHEVGLGAQAGLVVDRPNFYGHLLADISLDGSVRVGRRVELFAELALLRYQKVISVFSSQYVGLGHLGLGATGRFLVRDKTSLGVTGRLVLPTAFGLYEHAWPLAMEAGIAALFAAHRTVHFHLQAGPIWSFAFSQGASQPRLGAAITAGAELRPVPGFGFTADLVTGFGYEAPVDVLAVALALRWSDARRFGFELGANIPLAGREPELVVIEARWNVAFGALAPWVRPKGAPPAPWEGRKPG
jgi:hypothetical protein